MVTTYPPLNWYTLFLKLAHCVPVGASICSQSTGLYTVIHSRTALLSFCFWLFQLLPNKNDLPLCSQMFIIRVTKKQVTAIFVYLHAPTWCFSLYLNDFVLSTNNTTHVFIFIFASFSHHCWCSIFKPIVISDNIAHTTYHTTTHFKFPWQVYTIHFILPSCHPLHNKNEETSGPKIK